MSDIHRTPAQVREHYELEKRLASQLRNASRAERPMLYRSLYDQLFREITHHPQLQIQSVEKVRQEREALVAYELANLRPFLRSGQTYMEIGPGDCLVALGAARIAAKVYAVDVSAEITKTVKMPDNFALVLSTGCDIPVPAGSVDVAFSSQLMEHLHPDDAIEQLSNIYAALAPGGVYLCVTPNRLNGPHDVSLGFDQMATGFHLKEYTLSELRALFSSVGFHRVKALVRAGRIAVQIPAGLVAPLEWLLLRLPYSLHSRIAHWPIVRNILGIKLVGIKAAN